MNCAEVVSSVPSLSYFEAWTRWFNGQPVEGYRLFGVSILWWSRYGKIAEFLAGLTAVLDIIGPERIKSAATKLGAYGFSEAVERFRNERNKYSTRRKWLREVRKRMPSAILFDHTNPDALEAGEEAMRRFAEWEDSLSGSDAEEYRSADRLTLPATCLMMLLGYGILLGFVPLLAARPPAWAVVTYMVFIAIAVPLLVAKSSFFELIISTAWALVGLSLRTVYAFIILAISAPVARALGAQRPGYAIRVASIIIFIIGFHFDLLGS